ncbi:hypothetical protein MATL_G00042210 [Megalops atlanticus]|uniref:Secreted protein n=1 Tax=Megalops atlanticus TaxID=7932 RepID=A0A9D3TEC1_MEGAT|nr:hypothetical protein MATL_G00042210 [Megalops atlanticus]
MRDTFLGATLLQCFVLSVQCVGQNKLPPVLARSSPLFALLFGCALSLAMTGHQPSGTVPLVPPVLGCCDLRLVYRGSGRL